MRKVAVLVAAGVYLALSYLPLYAVDLNFDGDFRVRGWYSDNLTDAHDGDKNQTPGLGGVVGVPPFPLVNCANQTTKCNDEQAFDDLRFRLRTTLRAGVTTAVVTLDLANGLQATAGNNVATFQQVPNSVLLANPFLAGTGDTRFGIGFGNSYNVIGIREAYLKVDVLPEFSLKAGRQLIKLGHGLILDDTVGAIGGVGKFGPFTVMLADAVICDTNALGSVGTCVSPGNVVASGTGGDTDLYIARLNFTHMDDHKLGLFVTYLDDRKAATVPFFTLGDQSGDLWTVGATADGKFGPANLNLEVDYLTGTGNKPGGAQNDDLRGYNALASINGFTVGPANLGLTLLYTSGVNANKMAHRDNVNSISGNYALGNILLNNTERSDRDGGSVGGPLAPFIAGTLTGLPPGNQVGGSGFNGLGMTAIKLAASMNPLEKLGVDAAVIWAQTSETASSGPIVPGPSRNLGVELDGNVQYKLDQYATLFAGIGYLFVGDAWQAIYQDANAKDNMIKMDMGVSYRF